MGKIAGVDVLLSVVQGESTKVLGGQSGATLNRETNVIETTSKDANGWAESVAGVKSWSIEAEGFIVEDDDAYAILVDAWLSGTPIDVKLAYKNGKYYTGKALVAECPEEFPGDDAATYSVSLTGTGPLTEDEEEETP